MTSSCVLKAGIKGRDKWLYPTYTVECNYLCLPLVPFSYTTLLTSIHTLYLIKYASHTICTRFVVPYLWQTYNISHEIYTRCVMPPSWWLYYNRHERVHNKPCWLRIFYEVYSMFAGPDGKTDPCVIYSSAIMGSGAHGFNWQLLQWWERMAALRDW